MKGGVKKMARKITKQIRNKGTKKTVCDWPYTKCEKIKFTLENRLYTELEVANLFNLHKDTLAKYRLSEEFKGPTHIMIGPRIRYRPEDILEYLEENLKSIG